MVYLDWLLLPMTISCLCGKNQYFSEREICKNFVEKREISLRKHIVGEKRHRACPRGGFTGVRLWGDLGKGRKKKIGGGGRVGWVCVGKTLSQ